MDGRSLTGEACVEALLRAGFRIRNRGHGIAILVRGSSMVMIPDVGIIAPEMLRAILRSAGITWTELEAHLTQTPKRSGLFAKQRLPEEGTRADARNDPPSTKTRRG